MSRQSVANYTTSISVEKTVGEISALLAEARAMAILSEYDQGFLSAISFRIKTEFGILTFRLPANIEGVHAILLRSKKIPSALRTKDQARRVAWRIILHWLDAQLAIVQAGVVKLEQVFLPYAQDASGVTLYDHLKDRKFGEYLLMEGCK
jgi:hypothetical protein